MTLLLFIVMAGLDPAIQKETTKRTGDSQKSVFVGLRVLCREIWITGSSPVMTVIAKARP